MQGPNIDITSAKIACALRFNGYEYVGSPEAKAMGSAATDFRELIDPIVKTLTLHPIQEDTYGKNGV